MMRPWRGSAGASVARRAGVVGAAAALVMVLVPSALVAHGVAQDDAAFFLSNEGPAIGPYMYLGAKHMFTGYDHLLFLVGVVFFLYRTRDVLGYVSLFTVGHSLTLLAGVLWGVRANPFAVDAIIALSVAYKAFDNMDGFRRVFGVRPNTKVAVLVFGLFHGFGLATALQDYTLSAEGLVTNMLAFNIGVELGQVFALAAVLLALNAWRRHASFGRLAFATNVALMAGGFTLLGYQVAGALLSGS